MEVSILDFYGRGDFSDFKTSVKKAREVIANKN